MHLPLARHRRILFAVALSATCLLAPAVGAAPSKWPVDAWIRPLALADGVRWQVSDDGTHWRQLEHAGFTPQNGGGVREPHLSRGVDGLFRLRWRDDRHGAQWRYAKSADLVHWSEAAAAGAADGVPATAALWVPPWLIKEMLAAPAAKASVTPTPAPALEGFTADPAIRVFGDTYYLYPTSDKPHWQTTDFSVWTSSNLVQWNKQAMVLDVTRDLGWARIEAWAPDAIARDGKFFFYFCAGGEIGVASAASPLGPFKDVLGAPLIRKGTGIETNPIDPYPFIDDDGQAYLYYGNGRLANVYRLKPDMVTLDGPPAAIALKDFREGVVVFKRQGKYYFMWSIDDARSPDYRVGWGVADSPLGPVTPAAQNFIVLQRHGAAVGTAHHSVVNVPGTDRWYVAYHRHALPVGGGYQRQTVLARMEFDAAGNILPMDPLAAPFQPGDIGEPIVNGKGLPR